MDDLSHVWRQLVAAGGLPYIAGVAGVLVAAMTPSRLVAAVFHTFWTMIGVALGIGLGLGLAMHVYDELQRMQRRQDQLEQNGTRAAGNDMVYKSMSVRNTLRSQQSSAVLEDWNSYAALMRYAGYDVDDKLLRGQMIRKDAEFLSRKYPFTHVAVEKQVGQHLMVESWPSLPAEVCVQLGRFIDHIMRDYISVWYSKIDRGILYEDERERRSQGFPRDSVALSSDLSDGETGPIKRIMLMDTRPYRSVPFIDSTYHALCNAFGTLAARTEHVNVFSLVLLKWTDVLAKTFKAYRELRKLSIEKVDSSGGEATEAGVTVEFLLSGKLHRAVTFGLDVPSILYTDRSDDDEAPNGESPSSSMEVVMNRLYSTDVLRDCELDYNRVVAHRLCRSLLPKKDFASPAVSGLLVEIFAACVLQPLMNLFVPFNINKWILSATTGMAQASESADGEPAMSDYGHTTEDDEPRDRILSMGEESTDSNMLNLASSNEDIERVESQESSRDGSALGFGIVSTCRNLDFHRNAAFANSLREERAARVLSWGTRTYNDGLRMIQHKGTSKENSELFQELHSLARIFTSSTNLLAIRDASRRRDMESGPQSPGSPGIESPNPSKVALLTVETVGPMRRTEVPDDDSSFLLRAQPRTLNPISVYRDGRNHDLSYKCFLCTYEEPAIPSGSTFYRGGRYVRRCLLKYYPIDKTASVEVLNDSRRLDKRKGRSSAKQSSFLPDPFLRKRHSCLKWSAKGPSQQTFLTGPAVMEAGDFSAMPRTGKAVDFVHRMTLFENPTIDLAGKKFAVEDSSGRGHHRADGSALELSDCSLSLMLLTIGKYYGDDKLNQDTSQTSPMKSSLSRVEFGGDGYPIIFLKQGKQGDVAGNSDIKPYRLSFVRAALLLSTSRREAQMQCLVDCIKNGAGGRSTEPRVEDYLLPTQKILDFSNDRSREPYLLRDLKLGVYHIDREQLRRNGVLDPRLPARLISLQCQVESSNRPQDSGDMISTALASSPSTFKLKCTAVIDQEQPDLPDEFPYRQGGMPENLKIQEEWVIQRSVHDFQTLHKHLKTQISPSTTSARLVGAVGAATAAFSSTRNLTAAAFSSSKNLSVPRRRKILLPSIAQTGKAAAMSVGGSKKTMTKKVEALNEYLDYILTTDHPLSRCPEVLIFLGAFYPLLPETTEQTSPASFSDPMGRSLLSRTVLGRSSARRVGEQDWSTELGQSDAESDELLAQEKAKVEATSPGQPLHQDSSIPDKLSPAIMNKIDQVQLADVRNRIIELVRQQFGFQNASFLRSRMLSVVETASFVAVTKEKGFRKFLYDIHCQHLSSSAIAGSINSILEILWPDGIFLTYAEPLTPEEELALATESRRSLIAAVPDNLRSVLGRELTEDGLKMLHEMLQNRLVLKSLAYMLVDMIWVEVFPESRDILTCGSALDD